MIIYMTLETDDGSGTATYELEIEATGHINPPNLLADNPDDYYGEIYIEWDILDATFDDDNGFGHAVPSKIAFLKNEYQEEIFQHVYNEIMKVQGSGEE